MKQAVIDIGSNSMRLSVYETTETGTFTILFKDKIMAGLAGYVEEGALSPEGITRAILGLRSFRGTLRALNIPQVAVFATASLRNIRNTAQAVAEIQRGTGFAIEVLSGEEEARLGYAPGPWRSWHCQRDCLWTSVGPARRWSALPMVSWFRRSAVPWAL